MIVYRIGRTKFSKDLSGAGARLHGGRWNHILTSCIYTSESRALAVLEYTVNVNIDDIPRSLSISTFEIPDTGIYELTVKDLPGNWKAAPASSSTKDLGTKLLRSANSPIIKIPSAIIPQEFNFILNPQHPGSENFKILDVEDFVYDVRIKLV
ncbi:MAG: RES family NAD+ phosphorylase [Agriterribacter sp.]